MDGGTKVSGTGLSPPSECPGNGYETCDNAIRSFVVTGTGWVCAALLYTWLLLRMSDDLVEIGGM